MTGAAVDSYLRRLVPLEVATRVVARREVGSPAARQRSAYLGDGRVLVGGGRIWICRGPGGTWLRRAPRRTSFDL